MLKNSIWTISLYSCKAGLPLGYSSDVTVVIQNLYKWQTVTSAGMKYHPVCKAVALSISFSSLQKLKKVLFHFNQSLTLKKGSKLNFSDIKVSTTPLVCLFSSKIHTNTIETTSIFLQPAVASSPTSGSHLKLRAINGCTHCIKQSTHAKAKKPCISNGVLLQICSSITCQEMKGLRYLEGLLCIWKASLSHGKHFNTLKWLLI